ncbi:nucleotidyltransferase domain-containing protein [Salinibacterium sp. SYSU T00001]|uniref:nucleotidyltransferase domain-containing protein n=1 Tax=Homoserinimonas sedimenticola TaxID=2986805 RepID=UPI002235F228|nr:nucleotidyltransferase domain-containing protein [Salinibacterium sedimenticola]MCW4384464.1 nucleotidyltransferase domain-containing protein [Salinibacterium sedimenticola]
MNLSEPLDGLTSPVEAAVLRVLSRADAGFSGRQIHALAGIGSTSSVHRAVNNLARVGLVTAESRPPAIIYRPNRQHVLWPVVELGLESRSRALDGIREFCLEEVPSEVPEEARMTLLLYGSVARRESDAESDIDLLLVFPNYFDPEARADFSYRLGEHVERLTGNEAQIYSLERSEFEQRVTERDPFVANVLTDGIHICGPALPGMRASAA